MKPLRERLRRVLLIVFPIILAAIGATYYLAEEPYASTDDAFVRAPKQSINARVGGQAIEIVVVDNQHVQRGQVLFRIDPEPYKLAIDQAEARLGTARLQIDSLKATYRQQLADLQSAKDSADFNEREYARKKALVASDWTPRAVYERAETDLKVVRQHVASIEQQIANTVVALNGDPNIEIDHHPSVRAVNAKLDRAQLDLSYATVVALDDGIVTRVDDLQVGNFVNPGAAAFSLLSSQGIWIEANFRETGLTHMHPGQAATIDVDAYPDRTFKAHVVSMSPGTGSNTRLFAGDELAAGDRRGRAPGRPARHPDARAHQGCVSTLDPTFRPEGTMLFNLSRLYGSTIGIALVQIFFYGNTQAMHVALAKDLTPYRAAAHVTGSIAGPGLAMLNGMITRQAAFIGIIDQFKVMMIVVLMASPLLLFLRKPRPVN
jgi:membrane fusion protein (multidrug efflux system)